MPAGFYTPLWISRDLFSCCFITDRLVKSWNLQSGSSEQTISSWLCLAVHFRLLRNQQRSHERFKTTRDIWHAKQWHIAVLVCVSVKTSHLWICQRGQIRGLSARLIRCIHWGAKRGWFGGWSWYWCDKITHNAVTQNPLMDQSG